MSQKFVHLHNHSYYSLLDGACRPEDMCKRAKELDMPAIAITDHGNMFGAVEFFSIAKSVGIHPIIGQEFYITNTSRHDRVDTDGDFGAGFHLTVIANNAQGYSNLVKLSSMAYTQGFYYKPRIDYDILGELNEGLFVLSGCLKGEIPQKLLRGDVEGAKNTARKFLDIFGIDRFFIELQHHNIPEELRILPKLVSIAREMGIRPVATNDVHYIYREDADFHDKLLCIQTDKLVSDPSRMKLSTAEFYLKSKDQMGELFADIPDALTNTVWIAERTDVVIEMGKLKLPRFNLPADFDDIDAYLETKCFAGLVHRYEQVNAKLEDRLQYELSVIKRMGFSSYFAIVADFTDNARKMGVWVGPGRGSGAGSLAAYCLGITNVDPIKFDLLFERFLNPERISMPDFDIDFDDLLRDKVIEYTKKRYGEDAVCQIITFNTLKARAAIKDVGRIFDMPFAEVNRLTSLLPDEPFITIKDALASSVPLKALYDSDLAVKRILDYALKIENFPRNAGVHAAGVVITDGALQNYVPLYQSPKSELITQFDKDYLEKIGLLKMDFLGLTTLSILREATNAIEKNRGVRIDLDNIDYADPDVYKIFADGETSGIFQFESDGMRRYLKMLIPDKLDDLIAMNALYRPGPMQFIETYINRKHGRDIVSYPHPAVEDVLAPTYGIAVYQEQVMMTAQKLAGYSLGEADLLRRAMSKKQFELMEQQRTVFVSRAKEKNVAEKVANEVFDIIAEFAGYGFNKSHSTAYAILAYQTAYLKKYYPQEFLAAILTFSKSRESTELFLGECKRLGISVLPPDVRKSFANFTVEGDAIRFGLGQVKNIGGAVIELLVESRKKAGGFADFTSFVKDVDASILSKKVFQSLAECGALDEFRIQRSILYSSFEAVQKWRSEVDRERESRSMSLFGDNAQFAVGAPQLFDIPPWDMPTMLDHEKTALGVYLSGHPLDYYHDDVTAFTNGSIATVIAQPTNTKAKVAGMVINFRVNRKKVGIGELADSSGTVRAIFGTAIVEKMHEKLKCEPIMFIVGTLKKDDDSPVIMVEELLPLADLRKRFSGNVHIAVSLRLHGEDKLTAAVATLAAHRGNVPVVLHIATNDKNYTAKTYDYKCDASPELLAELRLCLGDKCVWLGQ